MKILLSLLCCVGVFTLSAQSRYFKESASWLQKSEACKPVLTYTEHKPVKRVTSIKDASAYQGWRMRDEGSTDLLFNESLKKHPSVIVDFGEGNNIVLHRREGVIANRFQYLAQAP